ncbi:hypothetical protein [Demequina maris]|uniref:hypothetical protein n=1 Tax=Demequina maris TaxID=1638982 RepID=UPI000784C871|nr:hypothetical protein [Demequina maris]
MNEHETAPEPAGDGARPAGWAAVLRQPKVWIPTAAAVTVIALSVGLIVTNARADDARAAAELPAASASPSTTATTEPDAAAEPGEATSTASASPTATASPSATPDAEPTAAADADDAADAQAAAERAAHACVPGDPVAVPARSTTQVLPGDAGATTTDITPKATQLYPGYTEVSFSADGTRLLTIESGEGRYTVRLLNAGTMASVLDLESLSDANPEAQAAWDPAGTRVAVARGLADDSLEISTVEARTAQHKVLATIPNSGAESVAWSADGSCLAIAVRGPVGWDDHDDPSVHTITVVRLSDGAITEIGPGAMPVWTADGSLVFWRVDAGRVALWRSSADGVEQSRVGSGAGKRWSDNATVSAPIASSDGTRVAYVDERGPVSVRVAGQDGSGDREVARLDLYWATVQWMPGEQALLVRGGKKATSTIGMWTVDLATGTVTRLKVPRAAGEILNTGTPLPDGSGVLTTLGSPPGGSDLRTMRIVLVRDGVTTQLGEPFYGSWASAPAWSLDGDTLVVSAWTALSIPRDVLGHLVVTRR